MTLKMTVYIGLLAAILLFCGDMILYYDKRDYKSDGTLMPLIEIMKNERALRLYIGGMIGPLAAFLYCIGFYHLVLLANPAHATFAWASFLINCLAIIWGGAYHCYFANLGLIGRHNHKATLDEVLKFLEIQKNVAFALQGVGFLAMTVMIALSWTILPRWMALLTPLVLLLLTPLANRLPKRLHMIICGGWTNLISVIYYIAVLIIVKQ
ncbi:MAG: hypothetical protein CSA13_01765 [Clostridiales bacterium]|nr:MAG: hypothetical protein CSA13_01765 [Clostridiales bacterium]